MPTLEFLAVYLPAMVLPGAVLTAAAGLEANRFAASIALSVAVLVGSLAAARILALGTSGFALVLVVVYAMTIVLGAWLVRRRGMPTAAGLLRDWTWVIPAATMALVAAYTLWAGPYTEVPADAWWHLARINDRLHLLNHGRIGSLGRLQDLISKGEAYAYTITAYFVYLTCGKIQAAMRPVALANTLLFACGVYSFALFIFEKTIADRRVLHAVAAAAVFFFITHFGLSVFSYVRYYVYAPTILNYVVYLTALAYFLRFIDASEGEFRYLAFAGILGVTALMVHKQEALFLATMGGAILLVRVIAAGYRMKHGMRSEHSLFESDRRSWVLFAVCSVAYLAVHAAAYVTIRRHDPLLHGTMADINTYVPFLRNLYILKPDYQFYQVITVWGVLVYLLFAVRFKEFSGNSYIVAGMLLPLLTVFNPVYTDLFLRFSWPHLLWRLCYLLPLPFVGGYLLVRAIGWSVGGQGLMARAGGVGAAAALVGLLLPINTTFFVSPFSRIYTLEPVARTNDYRLWKDMIAYLDTRKASDVITDPVTGYVVNGLTNDDYFGYKFYGLGAFRVDRGRYESRDFAGMNGWLVIINQRDGSESDTGRVGRHWPADIMTVSNWYSDAFKKYVTGNPRQFRKIWGVDHIDVYRIEEDPTTTTPAFRPRHRSRKRGKHRSYKAF
ncbi:MAG: hypothetical protein WB783_18525 [Arenicellales bacterium]